MSKKKKKKRRKNPAPNICDRHHICFQKRNWNKGYARAICMTFVRPVPVVYHRELHTLVKDVPVPDGALLAKAWNEYQKNAEEIDSYDVCRTIAWLYVHISDVEFRKAMQIQLDFFAVRIGRS